VGAALARLLAERGRRVLAVKPVESGTPSECEDGVLLAEATGQALPREALVRLRDPVAPPVAAEREGVAPDHEAWCRVIRDLASGHEVTLVEGAGGLLSPLTATANARDLAVALSASALVVAPDRLGTLNHTLLTLEALAAAAVPLLGVVLSAPETADESTGGNAESLRRYGLIERVAVVPRDAALPGAVADWVEAAL
jgi:dethiobiotin synthetase